MKQYIVTYFDGWYDHTYVIPESELNGWNDGSFRDHYEYKVYEVTRELTIDELFATLTKE